MRSVLDKTERETGNPALFPGELPIMRSVFARTERETGNYHGSKHKKPGTLRHIGTSPELHRNAAGDAEGAQWNAAGDAAGALRNPAWNPAGSPAATPPAPPPEHRPINYNRK